MSPDGQWVIYAADADGDRDIFLRSIGGQNPILLTAGSSDDDTEPVFSPDGSQIAFRSSRSGGGIFVMGRTGDGVRRVADDGYAPDWSPDGTRLVYTMEDVGITPLNMELTSDLWVVPVDGGDPTPLGVSDGVGPSWSPGGHRIAYGTRFQPESELGAQLDAYERLTDFGHLPVFLPDSRRILFVSGGKTFHVVDMRTGEIDWVYATPWDVLGPPRLTEGARLMFLTRRVTEGDVWLATIE